MPRFFLTHRFPSPTFHPLPCPIPPEPPQDHHKHKPTQNIAKRHKNETASLQDAKQMRRNTTARYGSVVVRLPASSSLGIVIPFFPRAWTFRTCLKNNKRVWIGMNSMKKILAAASSWYFTLQHFLGFKPVRLSVPVMFGLVCHRCHHLALGPKRCALNQPKSGTKV